MYIVISLNYNYLRGTYNDQFYVIANLLHP